MVAELLCTSFSTFPFVSCAKGDCSEVDCHTGKFKQSLYNGVGCHTFDGKSNADVVFKFIETISYETDDGKKKNYKSCSRDTESYNKFRKRFIDALDEYLLHQFIKRKQYYERKILFVPNDHKVYPFPSDWLFVSVDFISNYLIKAPVLTSGMGTKMVELSHLVLYEKRIVNNTVKQRTYNYFSDQSKHGWYSAIPALNHYMRIRKNALKQNMKLVYLWSDRGPKDFWCAPSHVYLSDFVKKTKVLICANTTPAGHSKTYHDQIGGTVQTFLDR